MDDAQWFRPLGSTDLNISPLGLGTVKFGRNTGVKYPEGFELPDESALADLLALAKNLRINLLDTAPAYGLSEERLGRLLKGQRQDWIIVGKAGEEFENCQSRYVFSPDHFEMSLARSLKRLRTDYLDVLLIHSDGRDEEILANEALIEKLHDFKRRGLVRAIGASTKSTAGGILALELLDVVMAAYNPAYRAEKPVLDYAAQTGKGALLKKALASGHFLQNRHCEERNDAAISGRPEIASATPRNDEKSSPLQAALDFAFAHPGVSAVITGTINPDHLQENAAAVRNALSNSQ